MKLRLLTPIVCAAAIAMACGKSGDDDDNDKGSGGAASGGTETGSGGDGESTGGKGSGGDGESTGGKGSGEDGSGGAEGGADGSGGAEGGADGSGGAEGGADGSGGAGESTLVLTAKDFEDGEELPDEFTCEGQDFGDGVSPELSWSGAREGTKTYALVFVDTTLVDAGLPRFGYHWAAWNIPADVTGLPKEFTGDATPPEWDGGEQFRAGPPVDHDAFFGPCPSWQFACENGTPRSHDEYAFVLYTFDEELTVPAFDDVNYDNYAHQLDEYLAAHATDVTQLTTASDAAPGVKPTVPACPAFTISATDFEYGEALPDANTCEEMEFGDGESPELSWTGAPETTVTYALVFSDTTLVDAGLNRPGYHWAAWNIPVGVDGIPAGMSGDALPVELEGGEQFRAGPDVGHDAFFGPCPSWKVACELDVPRSNDSYQFTLYAFDKELDVPEFDTTNYQNYVHQLNVFFAASSPLAKTGLNATSDAAPGVKPTVPACPALTFTVEGMTEGGEVPAVNSCEGKAIDAGISPKFSWSDPYELTQSYAVVVRNETSNRNLWVTYNIPATATGIDADVADGATPAELLGGSQISSTPFNDPPQAYPICPSYRTACPTNPQAQASSNITYTLYTFEKALTFPTTINALATYLETNAAQSVVLNVTSDAYPNAAPSICP
jgi:phosphatidylethanolamine-binding protein (PEBP) family uncharacterized protein